MVLVLIQLDSYINLANLLVTVFRSVDWVGHMLVYVFMVLNIGFVQVLNLLIL